MGLPLSNDSLLPGPAEVNPGLVQISVTVDPENLDWLNEVARSTGRSRSDALREILTAVREQTTAHPAKAS